MTARWSEGVPGRVLEERWKSHRRRSGQRLEGIRRVTRESKELLEGDREVVGGCSEEGARKVTEGLLYRASGEHSESDLRRGRR